MVMVGAPCIMGYSADGSILVDLQKFYATVLITSVHDTYRIDFITQNTETYHVASFLSLG